MEKIKRSHKKNKFKIPAPTWNEIFELPDESYSISDIQDYFEYVLKNMMKRHHSIKTCVNKIENRVTFKIKTGY